MTDKKYQPDYICWHETDFMADRAVIRMTPHQRLMYRALCQTALFCDTRPYLPDDDEQLYILADADSLQHWRDNRAAVLVKFQSVTVEDKPMLAHRRVLADWDKLQEAETDKQRRWDAGHAVRVNRAQKAAQARWGTQPPCLDDAQTMLEQCSDARPCVNAYCNTKTKHNAKPEPERITRLVLAEAELTPQNSLRSEPPNPVSVEPSSLVPGLDDSCSLCGHPINLCFCLSKAETLRDAFVYELARKNPKADVPSTGMKRAWLEDFRTLLLWYAPDDIIRMIHHSLSPRWVKYTVRPRVLVEHAEEIAKQLKIKMLPVPPPAEPGKELAKVNKLGKDTRTAEEIVIDEDFERIEGLDD